MTDDPHTPGTDRSHENAANRHRTHHDWTESGSVVTAILDAVDELDPTFDPGTAPSVQSFVDVDALDRLFDPAREGGPTPEGTVTFRYDAYWVTVGSDGFVTAQVDVPHDDGRGRPE